MSRILDRLSWLVTVRPYITIAILVLITVVMVIGAGRRAEVIEGAALAFLPPGNAVANALNEIEDVFTETGDVSVVTIIFRGEALTPGGLAQMDALVEELVADPKIGALLAPGDSVGSPALLFRAVLQVDSFDSVTQAEIDAARNVPEVAAALTALTGEDADGTPVAIATLTLVDTGDERIKEAERTLNEVAIADEGPLRVSSVSPIVIEDEYKEATESGLVPLLGLALILILALILLFLRTLSDLLLTFAGLLMSLIWVIGVEGWLGPDALGWIGPPSSLTAMVPIIVISLTVDYAIQAVSHYREQRTEGTSVIDAVRTGLGNVTIPLVLAAITTMVSLLANLFSPISVVGDFGIVAALGVGMSLIVMLTLLPAARTIIDRRSEARGKLKPPRPVSNALPGIRRLAEVLGTSVSRQPAPYFVVILAITIGFGFAATRLESGFDIRDILPRGGEVLEDIETLESAVGGSTEMASILVKAEATETRTYLNLHDLREAFDDPELRLQAAAGPIVASYELIVRDWISDSGEPGDKYDPELAALFHEASAGVELDAELLQQFLDRLREMDPSVSHVLVDNPDGPDSLLVQFPAFSADPQTTRALQEELEALWFGEDGTVTATSPTIVSIAVTDEITGRQTEAISTTIAMAFGILAIFFWVTLRQPVLAFIAVAPVVLVLIWVLGTMALVGIPYTLVTAIITALSIGIGVDYTIHVVHRYREEFSHARNPEQAAIRTLSTTGSALLGSALTTALGLGALVLAPTLASREFGITAAITIAYSLIIAIVLVPPAMTVWGAYQNMKLRSMVERVWEELDVAIEGVHEQYEQESS
ncbi:MAG: MMPL family transporter [Dehalococcoidia bacterium]|nr:MMPL family transporter [Dehalococcoidia bacterium]MYA52886.1 MMPL family transporter [Dehalococcoidia bacterium]